MKLEHIITDPTALVEGKIYLKLLNGRKDPDTDMHDFGPDGPWLGPLKWVHSTYMTSLTLCFEDGSDWFACCHDDLLLFDGIYYGDFEIGVRK